MATLKTVWTVKHGVDIINIGRNIFQFQFFHWRDKQKILMGQPWHFDRYPLLLEEVEKLVRPSDLIIYKLPMWVRFYDLPLKGRSNDENARVLGNKVGEFVEMLKVEKGSMEKSLRIRKPSHNSQQSFFSDRKVD